MELAPMVTAVAVFVHPFLTSDEEHLGLLLDRL